MILTKKFLTFFLSARILVFYCIFMVYSHAKQNVVNSFNAIYSCAFVILSIYNIVVGINGHGFDSGTDSNTNGTCECVQRKHLLTASLLAAVHVSHTLSTPDACIRMFVNEAIVPPMQFSFHNTGLIP